MLRPRSGNSGASIRAPPARTGSHSRKLGSKSPLSAVIFKNMYTILKMLVAFSVGMIVQNFFHTVGMNNSIKNTTGDILTPPLLRPPEPLKGAATIVTTTKTDSTSTTTSTLPPEFHRLVDRARLHQQHCGALGLTDATDHVQQAVNNHTAHLPQFGILKAAAAYDQDNNDYPYTCQLPPEMECSETQFTVIFMAYNPDRLSKLYNQILKMTTSPEFKPLVHQVLIVWNGNRDIEETKMGKTLASLTKEGSHKVRISYPLKAGFPNDLMNRYHPRLDISTKAIMYYDDDGPFYSFQATLAGFELWKRNANAQIGAMARKLDLNARQAQEKVAVLNGPGDRFFVSHCPTDSLRYNYNEFAQFGANMVLPSGSFLHSDYLCWLWHPVFAEIRQYVKDHPVNPDDGTVSIIVSQLSGRAPKVYPRRINGEGSKRRRLLDMTTANETDTSGMGEEELLLSLEDADTVPRRRRLMDGIDWDNGKQAEEKKNRWGKLRSDAANSLVRYFGSMNSGSIGWCYGTPNQSGQYCKPEMPSVGQLPWMKADHTPRDACP
jgi:hypothetical protein